MLNVPNETIDVDYRPSEDEPFMNERQVAYFKAKLLTWRDDILRESRDTVSHLQTETENHPDLADRASSETDRALELRTRDRQRKLISKIDEARSARSGRFSLSFCRTTSVSRLSRKMSSFHASSLWRKYSRCLSFMKGSSSDGR